MQAGPDSCGLLFTRSPSQFKAIHSVSGCTVKSFALSKNPDRDIAPLMSLTEGRKVHGLDEELFNNDKVARAIIGIHPHTYSPRRKNRTFSRLLVWLHQMEKCFVPTVGKTIIPSDCLQANRNRNTSWKRILLQHDGMLKIQCASCSLPLKPAWIVADGPVCIHFSATNAIPTTATRAARMKNCFATKPKHRANSMPKVESWHEPAMREYHYASARASVSPHPHNGYDKSDYLRAIGLCDRALKETPHVINRSRGDTSPSARPSHWFALAKSSPPLFANMHQQRFQTTKATKTKIWLIFSSTPSIGRLGGHPTFVTFVKRFLQALRFTLLGVPGFHVFLAIAIWHPPTHCCSKNKKHPRQDWLFLLKGPLGSWLPTVTGEKQRVKRTLARERNKNKQPAKRTAQKQTTGHQTKQPHKPHEATQLAGR